MTPRPQPNIRARLLRVLMLMTLLTFGLAALLYAVMDLKLLGDHMRRDLRVLAEVVGENCVSALVFNSPQTARRHLATLRREYQILRAVLYDASGREFARWQRESGAMPWPEDAPAGGGDFSGLLDTRARVGYEIEFDGRPVGRIVIEARLVELTQQLREFLVLGGLFAVLTMGVALVVALRLQRRISAPILALAEQSRRISENQTFSERISDPLAGEELAHLVAAFNAVLDGIEQREFELSQHVDALDQANRHLRQLATAMVLIEQTERARLAGELHDSPMQKLAFAQMQIDASRNGHDAESEERLAAGLELLREGIAELRTLQFDLSPPVLHQKGLPKALEWLALNTESRWGLVVACVLDPALPELGRELSILLFQCARELVCNVIKHAQAGRIEIWLAAHGDELELGVADDGVGIAPAGAADSGHAGAGFGLYSIYERIALIGGRLIIEPLDPGTRVMIRLPVESLRAVSARYSLPSEQVTVSKPVV